MMAAIDSKGKQLGNGSGTTKKQGEQSAAQDALIKLKKEGLSSSS